MKDYKSYKEKEHVEKKLNELIELFIRKVEKMSVLIDNLTAAVATNTDLVKTAVGLLQGIETPADLTATQAAVDQITANNTALQTAIPSAAGNLPSAPTNVTFINAVLDATNTQATVSFTTPASDGGSPITDYTVTSSPDNITATGNSSPIVVTGLTAGTTYTFAVTATNANGTGPASGSVSNTASSQVAMKAAKAAMGGRPQK